MRGIISAGGYVPFRRLDRAEIARLFGSGGGKGTRAVASYDEDTTSLGVEAARPVVRAVGDTSSIKSVSFATTAPAYVDKTNATTIHAALRLDSECLAIDMCGSVRAAIGGLRLALESGSTTLVVASDIRTGLPTSGDESTHGDGASAFVVGDEGAGAVIAEYLGGASITEEFTDRWRIPGAITSRQWEERFGEIKYIPLGEHAWNAALKQAELSPGDVTVAVVTGPHARAVRGLTGRLGVKIADDLSATVGWTGAAHAGLLLANVLESAEPGQVIALLSLADGADVLLFRVTDAITNARPQRTVAEQIAQSGPLLYGKFLSWRGMVTVEPPRRPEPARTSSSASARNDEWKYGFVASRDRKSGQVLMPPARVSTKNDEIDDMDQVPMADVPGTVVTYTVDRLAYSPSPPVVFAVVDFDGGGRLPVELTDVDPEAVSIGMRVEMTFRRLHTADGIHNYFWKGRPVRP
jgi:3-hydroxy-3-methylglutaryl CoA synthase